MTDATAAANGLTEPKRHLTIFDAICVIVGIVIGAGIFKTPQLVALNTSSGSEMMLMWLVGGFLCLCGALCYAELATTYPHVGGEYVYLSRSFGQSVGFLFVWARATVIQTGSIAMLAYIFGDYMTKLLALGAYSPLIYALLAVAGLTVCNVVGLRAGKWTQNLLTAAKILGVLAVATVGLLFNPSGQAPAGVVPPAGLRTLGLAMVFVLLTFGGWSEAAYVSGELRNRRRGMLWVLVGSILLLTAIYMVVNFAYLRILGFEGLRSSSAVAADAMAKVHGRTGGVAVSVLVAISALGAVDGCIFTGARAMSALGKDYGLFRRLGKWHERFKTPANALLAQSAIAVMLILLPAMGKSLGDALGSGFQTAVAYTAPAFYAFLLLTGLAVLVLRIKEPHVERPFRVPLFPVTLTLFCLMSVWMLYSALDYKRFGAVVGVVVLLAGVPVYFLCRRPAPDG